MEDLWKQVLAEIEVEVSKPIFLTFFKPIILVSLENSIATIDAPTHITADYVEKRYYSLIKKVLDKKTNSNISLVFTSEGRNVPTSKKTLDTPLFAKDVQLSARKGLPARIRPDYTFDSLAVSESNQLAYTAATTVAQNPGTRYNPLFFYGTVGVGKTHLMNAVANKVFAENDNTKVIYMTTEEFTNEVVEAIRDKTTADIRKKFRNVDILLLDDIQFLAGKDRVQEELFHTFNALIDRGGQIIFSSDRPPSEIRKLEARLASRFEGGLSVDIQPPDFELRTAILLIKSKKYGLNLSLEAAKAIAENIEDARALEGFLLKLSSIHGAGDITPETILPMVNKTQTKVVFRPDAIIDAICTYYNLKTTQLKGVKRDSYLVGPRHMCMYLLKEEAGLTYVEIGNLLGGRDHSTVMHAVEKIGKTLENSDKTREEMSFIKRKIKEDISL
ncbi:MAG TPA: chromosomal replication initiator protein DnaA [Patescibacteria group bacterium]|nr:chromosomal replication initiator protein DnaA [Patescibacteria group bacterium]